MTQQASHEAAERIVETAMGFMGKAVSEAVWQVMCCERRADELARMVMDARWRADDAEARGKEAAGRASASAALRAGLRDILGLADEEATDEALLERARASRDDAAGFREFLSALREVFAETVPVDASREGLLTECRRVAYDQYLFRLDVARALGLKDRKPTRRNILCAARRAARARRRLADLGEPI